MSVVLTHIVNKTVRTKDRQSMSTLESGRISEENAWANEIRSRNAWGKRQWMICDQRVMDKIAEPRPRSRIDRHLWKFLIKVRVDEEVDDYGRRHTNPTNLWKEGRGCFTYQDQTLVGWDVQPMSVFLPEIVTKTVRTEDRQSTPTLESGRISEEIAWANEIRSRNAWGKKERKVQGEAVARYIVVPCNTRFSETHKHINKSRN